MNVGVHCNTSKVNRDAARARDIAPVIPHKANEKNKPPFFARTQGSRAHRAGRRTAQALQARRAPLRKDRNETSDPSSASPLAYA